MPIPSLRRLLLADDQPLADRIQRAAFMLTMVVVLAIGAASLGLSLVEIPAREKEEHVHTLRIIGGRLGESIENFTRNLEDLSHSSLVSNALTDSAGRDAYLKPFLAGRQDRSGNMDLALLDYRGRPVAGRLQSPLAAERQDQLAKAVLESGTPHFSVDAAPSRLLAAYPVRFPYNRETIGVLLGAFDLGEKFQQEASNLSPGHGISLLQGERWLNRFPDQAHAQFAAVRLPLPLPEGGKALDLHLEMYSTELTWLTPALVRMALYLTIGALFGLVVWRTAGRVATSLTRRLNRLAVACASAATGRPFAVANDSAADEIGILSRTLRQAFQAHEEIQGHLQQLVEQKTAALNESLERYHQAFEINAAVKLMIDPEDGRIVDANRAACNYYGYSRAQLLALRIFDLNVQAPEKVLERIRQAVSSSSLYFQFRHRLASGEVRDIENYSGPVTVGGKVYLYSIIHDITERKRAQQALRQAEEKYRSVVESIKEVVFQTDAEGRWTYLNPAWTEVTGFPIDDSIGRLFLDYVHPEDREHNLALFKPLIERQKDYCRHEIRYLHREGGFRWIEVFARLTLDAEDRIVGTSGTLTDITERHAAEEQLEHIAHYDALTQLPNRILLADRLQQALAQAKRSSTLVGVCYLDLDGFKAVNDQQGHAAGDKLLVEVAQRLTRTLRGGDTVARLGGDEFVLLLVGLKSEEQCEEVLQRTIRAVSEPVFLEGAVATVSASIGVAFYPETEESVEALLRQADHAMYEAKQAGKNRYQFFNPEQDQRVRVHRSRLQELELALERGEFLLHYQPQVNLRTGSVVGLEALLRWRHPSLGLLLPGAFLFNLNNPKLESRIDQWVLRAAIDQIEAWQDKGLSLPVGVNISASYLESADFVSQLRALLAAHPVAAGLLELEVLESTALEDVDRVAKIIRECHEMGVPFALDDFGTGYSSLTYFRRLPAETLKIDMSFVQNMLHDADDSAIVKGVIGLTKAFGRKAVAEGVKTAEHGQALQRLGCDIVQGFGIAQPMPAAEVPYWVRNWQAGPIWQDARDPAPAG